MLLGTDWTQATAGAGWSGRNGPTSVVYDGKMWVMAGLIAGTVRMNDVWSSADGITWIEATSGAAWGARHYHASVVHDDKIWVMGGAGDSSVDYNDVWYSTNGVTWTQATASAGWSTRYGHTSIVQDGKIWVIGGRDSGGTYKNDVWYSADGVTWTQATASAGWSGRNGLTSVVYDGKMWVIAGYAGSHTYKNDVWYSTNGITWTQATSSAGWDARSYPASVVHDGKIWVMGGSVGGSMKNDVWYSTSGVTWTRATSAAGWSARHSHTSIVQDDKIWVLGGSAGSGTYKNDIWYSYTPPAPPPTPTTSGTTNVDIVNLALSKIGSATISDWNEATRERRTATSIYENMRDRLLEMYPWNFAMKRASLSSVGVAPSFEFTYAYTLPTDCIRVYELFDNPLEPYAIEAGYLLTDLALGQVRIKYISKVTDESMFPPSFVNVFALAMAAEIAPILTGDRNMRISLLNELSLEIRNAYVLNAIEGRTRVSRGSQGLDLMGAWQRGEG